jgi:hypothetical protein
MKLNENIFKKRQNPLYSKYDEENWDEYEIENGDECYVFLFTPDNEIKIEKGKFLTKNNNITIKIDSIGLSKLITDNVRDSINNSSFSNTKFTISKYKVFLIVVSKEKILNLYKEIHEICRKFYYDEIKSISNKISELNKISHSIDLKIINLKKTMLSPDEFPNPSDIILNKDEYITIRYNYDSKDQKFKEIDTNVLLTTIKKNESGDDGYDLINLENNEKLSFLKSIERLEKLKYTIILSNRTTKFNFLFITSIIEGDGSYVDFIKSSLDDLNSNVSKNISKEREYLLDSIKNTEKVQNELKNIRDKYNKFNYSNLIKNI